MTGLAILAKSKGWEVTGSDINEVFITDEILKRNGINWSVGFSEKNLSVKPDLVIVTGAHGGLNNIEAKFAVRSGIKTIMQGQAVGLFMEGYKQISVAGSHGKTTTSALIAAILEKAGLDPSFAIGCADIPILGTSAKYGKGEYFVAEADEYATCPNYDSTPKFLWQNPDIAVITNIEYDHPDIYKDLDDIKLAYKKFIAKLSFKGLLIACLDNKNVASLINNMPNVITYGMSPSAKWRVDKVNSSFPSTSFWVSFQNRQVGNFRLAIPGVHNAVNALASIIVAVEAGVSIEKIQRILPLFSGTKRRFEFIMEKNGIKIYDDYAHHPTEIKSTLKAAKDWFPQNRIIVIFQPHTYSRTKALFKEFSLSFKDADVVIITDIYSSAREKETYGISSQTLVEETSKNHPRVLYLKGEQEVVNYVQKYAKVGDVIITMGAGDVYKWHRNIINVLKT